MCQYFDVGLVEERRRIMKLSCCKFCSIVLIETFREKYVIIVNTKYLFLVKFHFC